MSGLIERITYVNGEERQRSQVPYEFEMVEAIEIPVTTIHPPLLRDAEIKVELKFDPPLVPKGAPE